MLTPRNIAIAAILVIVAVFAMTDPIPQDPAYHSFVDARNLYGIANFWNVISNLPFLVVGVWGLLVASRLSRDDAARTCYLVFFVGLVMTALGSSWYHLAPDNASLGWDRLAMTIAFAGLFPAMLAEFVSARLARMMLVVMLFLGPVSIGYWQLTEGAGMGDLRPYAIVQFVPLLAMLAILIFNKRPNEVRSAFYWLLAFYLAAKLFEFQDVQTYEEIGISGHTLKHLFAGISAIPLVLALSRRSPRGEPV